MKRSSVRFVALSLLVWLLHLGLLYLWGMAEEGEFLRRAWGASDGDSSLFRPIAVAAACWVALGAAVFGTRRKGLLGAVVLALLAVFAVPALASYEQVALLYELRPRGAPMSGPTMVDSFWARERSSWSSLAAAQLVAAALVSFSACQGYLRQQLAEPGEEFEGWTPRKAWSRIWVPALLSGGAGAFILTSSSGALHWAFIGAAVLLLLFVGRIDPRRSAEESVAVAKLLLGVACATMLTYSAAGTWSLGEGGEFFDAAHFAHAAARWETFLRSPLRGLWAFGGVAFVALYVLYCGSGLRKNGKEVGASLVFPGAAYLLSLLAVASLVATGARLFAWQPLPDLDLPQLPLDGHQTHVNVLNIPIEIGRHRMRLGDRVEPIATLDTEPSCERLAVLALERRVGDERDTYFAVDRDTSLARLKCLLRALARPALKGRASVWRFAQFLATPEPPATLLPPFSGRHPYPVEIKAALLHSKLVTRSRDEPHNTLALSRGRLELVPDSQICGALRPRQADIDSPRDVMQALSGWDTLCEGVQEITLFVEDDVPIPLLFAALRAGRRSGAHYSDRMLALHLDAVRPGQGRRAALEFLARSRAPADPAPANEAIIINHVPRFGYSGP